MLFRKDYSFLQVLVGTASFFIPIVIILSLSGEVNYARSEIMTFTLFGLAVGVIGGLLILDGYYKLTEQLKFEEYEDFKRSLLEES